MPDEQSTTPGALRAVALVCTLKPSLGSSSSELIAEQVLATMRAARVDCESLHCVDYAISPGVEADMGCGDEWPELRDKVLGADILAFATPVWLGHMSSVAQRVLERLDAELSNADQAG